MNVVKLMGNRIDYRNQRALNNTAFVFKFTLPVLRSSTVKGVCCLTVIVGIIRFYWNKTKELGTKIV